MKPDPERIRSERRNVWNTLLSGTTVCPYCSKGFKTQNAVKVHIVKTHLGRDWLYNKPV